MLVVCASSVHANGVCANGAHFSGVCASSDCASVLGNTYVPGAIYPFVAY